MLVTQAKLSSKVPDATVETVVWLPKDSRVKQGSVISLGKDERKWLVEEQYASTTTDSQNLHQGWGLDLPRSQRTER